MPTAQAPTELHVVPQRQSVDAKYYTREILENSLLPSLARTASTGSVLKKKMVPEMSSVIFQRHPAIRPRGPVSRTARGGCAATLCRGVEETVHSVCCGVVSGAW